MASIISKKSSSTVAIQPEITTNTTVNGNNKGLNKVFPVNSNSNIQITADKGTYTIGDVINLKRSGNGGVEIVRGTDVRLEGKRDINNKFHITNKGGYGSIIFDRLDGSTLVGSVIGDITSGHSGIVTTSSYTELKEGGTSKDLTVIGTGFSANMIVSVSANATLNSWTFVNNNQITLNLDAVGLENDTVTVTYDNGDVFVDIDAITIQAIASSIILFEDDFTGAVLDTAKWDLTNPNILNIQISQSNKLLFTRVLDVTVASSIDNNITSDNSYAKGGALSVLCNADVGFTNSGVVARWIFNGTTDFIRVDCSLGVFKLIVKAANVTEYNFTTAINSNSRLKITYDNSNDIKFWYWSGASWTQMGTTQNFNLGTSGQISLSAGSNLSDSLNDVYSFDEVRVTSADYATELPV